MHCMVSKVSCSLLYVTNHVAAHSLQMLVSSISQTRHDMSA